VKKRNKKTKKRRKISGIKRKKTTQKPKTMAKRRKKTSGRRKTRRSRLSGNSGALMQTLAIVGGAVAAGFLNKVIPATVNDKITAGAKIAAGLALPMASKNPKTRAMLQAAGSGMIAVGSVDLLKSFGVLSGDFDIPTINEDVLNADDLAVINGLGEDVLAEDVLGEDLDVINGSDDDEDSLDN